MGRSVIPKSPAGTYTISRPVDLRNPGRPDRQRQQTVTSQPRAALRAHHAEDRIASSPPRGALKRTAGTQNLFERVCRISRRIMKIKKITT
jgi:hypothetical protein